MSDQEAINILENEPIFADDDYEEAIQMGVNALREKLQRETERNTPMKAAQKKATERTKDPAGCGVFGIGTNIFFCPKCEMFNTPTHKFCWNCGQRLEFDVDATEPKGEPHV